MLLKHLIICCQASIEQGLVDRLRGFPALLVELQRNVFLGELKVLQTIIEHSLVTLACLISIEHGLLSRLRFTAYTSI